MKIVMRSIPIILSAILLAVILANYQFVKKCSQANKTFAKSETTTRWQLNRNEKEINALKQWVIALSFENPSDAVSSDTLRVHPRSPSFHAASLLAMSRIMAKWMKPLAEETVFS